MDEQLGIEGSNRHKNNNYLWCDRIIVDFETMDHMAAAGKVRNNSWASLNFDFGEKINLLFLDYVSVCTIRYRKLMKRGLYKDNCSILHLYPCISNIFSFSPLYFISWPMFLFLVLCTIYFYFLHFYFLKLLPVIHFLFYSFAP